MKTFLLLLLLSSCLAVPVQEHRRTARHRAIRRAKANEVNVRLPRHLWPVQYDIRLKALFDDQHTIEGEVTIEMDCETPSSNITVHILQIEIQSYHVEDDSGNQVEVSRTEEDEVRQFFILHLEKSLEEGKTYFLKMKYNGLLNNELAGFYRSTYEDEHGKTQKMAASQMQATDARRAFPCFDEPEFKAIFKISMARMDNMTSTSNMRVKESVQEEGNGLWVWDHYEESKRMSTYLVALVVSDFDFTTYDYDAEWKLSIHARPSAIAAGQTDYAGHIGPEILSFLEDFYDIAYPLPKCDMIALPDFAPGGMENWGLIAYRESRFLYDSATSGVTFRRSIAGIVGHELAHMWFGDLVTTAWWEDLWLNEGFASYVEYFGVDRAEPTWRALDEVLTSDVQYVMRLDSLETSHPISVTVNNPDEINEIFDAISYSKGSSIIRMMDFFLTRHTFQQGVSNYLKAFSYSNARRDDLWHYLTQQAIEDHPDGSWDKTTVKDIMDTWTLQMGYPVVTLIRDSDTSGILSQKRFLSRNKTTDEDDGYSWWIPITFTDGDKLNFTVENTKPVVWMSPEDKSMRVDDLTYCRHVPVFLNIQETGYYRVNYDENNWDLIRRLLNNDFKKIAPTQRCQLIDDALNLARGGELNYEIALSITEYLHKEDDFLPLDSAFTAFSYIDLMMQRSSGYGEFKTYMRNIVDSLYEGVQLVESNDLQSTYKNITVIGKACYYGNQICVEDHQEQFRRFQLNYDESNPDDPQNQIQADLKSDIYCTAIQHGSDNEWNFLWRHYELTSSASEKTTVLAALACSSEVWILSRYLGYILDETSGVRTQDGARVFSNVASNSVGRSIAWDFVRNEWDEIMRIYGGGIMLIDEFIPSVTNGFNTELELKELLTFNEQTQGNQGAAEMSFKQSIDTVEMNLEWMQTYYDDLINIFTSSHDV